jgi:hypothetical protein
VTFEAGSKLSHIESAAFALCSSLSSICIPSSVELLCAKCFGGCGALSRVIFEPGSKLSSVPEACWNE